MPLLHLALLAVAVAAPPAEPKLSWSVPGESCWQPAWSPDGTRVACRGTRYRYRIYQRGRLTQELDDGHEAAWSPAGSRLFTLHEGEFGIALWDSTGFLGWAYAPGLDHAAWNPDGKTIWYSSGSVKQATLAVADAKDLWTEERIRRLFQKCLGDPGCMQKELQPKSPQLPGSRPAISRDGDVAFVRYAESATSWTNQLWILGKGAAAPALIPSDFIDRLAWSPDGRWLAASVSREGAPDLEVIDLRRPEAGFRRLSAMATQFLELSLSWSPDGKSIAFLRALPPPPRYGALVPPGFHFPHDPPPPTAVARVSIASGEVADVLVPKRRDCSYTNVAWSKGGLLTELRCPAPADQIGDPTDVFVYDVQ